MVKSYDLIVVGGGPGGYVAAIRAAQLGMKAALVERDRLGGVCLNMGCIPTKALLRSAEVYTLIQNADDYGITAEAEGFDLARIAVGFDLARVVARSRAVAEQLSAGVTHLLRKNRIDVVKGQGSLTPQGTLQVVTGDTSAVELQSPHIVLATGARPRTLPPLEPDGTFVWNYRDALTPASVPKSLLVVGAGAIGIEFACFYHALGAEVTVVEMVDRVLPAEDEDISEFARKAFSQRGLKIISGASVKSLDKEGDEVVVGLDVKGELSQLRVNRVISAVGIVGNVEGLGLEHTQVQVEGSHIVTDEWCRTAHPGIYAIGDIAGPPWLAHKASHEGILCVEKIAGVEHVQPLEMQNIPRCTYSQPQIASVGLSERQARALGHEVKVGRFPFHANGKALAMGEPEGLVKTVFDAKTGQLLGAHMAGAEVTELIQGYTLAMNLETTETELLHSVFPHPTLSEAMQESVLAAYGRAIHI